MAAYNIFRKTPDTPLAWVETVVNLDEAKKRLNQPRFRRTRRLFHLGPGRIQIHRATSQVCLAIISRFHGLCSADLVAFDEGAYAQAALVTFARFLNSNRSCLSADIGLSGSRDFNWESD